MDVKSTETNIRNVYNKLQLLIINPSSTYAIALQSDFQLFSVLCSELGFSLMKI